MLNSAYAYVFDALLLLWLRLGLYLQITFCIFLVLGASWLLWRVWAFTIRPFFHPLEPKELPYLIPSIHSPEKVRHRVEPANML